MAHQFLATHPHNLRWCLPWNCYTSTISKDDWLDCGELVWQLNWQTCQSHSLYPRALASVFFCIDINRNSIWANQMVKNIQKTHGRLCLESPPIASHSSISGARRFEGRKCGGQGRRCCAATERIHFCGFANRKDSKRKIAWILLTEGILYHLLQGVYPIFCRYLYIPSGQRISSINI